MKQPCAWPTNHLACVEGGCDQKGDDVRGKYKHGKSNQGHPGFYPAPKLLAAVGLAANTSVSHFFPLISQHCDRGRCLPAVGEDLALLHPLLCPAGEDGDYSLFVCAFFPL